MISIDLRNSTIVVTPASLQATLDVLGRSGGGSVDARLANVIVLDQPVSGEQLAAAFVASKEEIAQISNS